jgi:hypothetical protein
VHGRCPRFPGLWAGEWQVRSRRRDAGLGAAVINRGQSLHFAQRLANRKLAGQGQFGREDHQKDSLTAVNDLGINIFLHLDKSTILQCHHPLRSPPPGNVLRASI